MSLSDSKKLEAWAEHYSRLFNVEFDWPSEALNEVPAVAGPSPMVTVEMVNKFLCKMKSGKAPGLQVSYLKWWKQVELNVLLRILTEAIFTHGTVPKDWEESYILNLYKGKGEALERGNYRGLKLTYQVMKVVEHMLEVKIWEMVSIDEMQFGFVPGKVTTDAIFIARQLQKKSLPETPLFCFYWVGKSIPRKVLWWALRSVGVEEWTIRIIQGM